MSTPRKPTAKEIQGQVDELAGLAKNTLQKDRDTLSAANATADRLGQSAEEFKRPLPDSTPAQGVLLRHMAPVVDEINKSSVKIAAKSGEISSQVAGANKAKEINEQFNDKTDKLDVSPHLANKSSKETLLTDLSYAMDLAREEARTIHHSLTRKSDNNTEERLRSHAEAVFDTLLDKTKELLETSKGIKKTGFLSSMTGAASKTTELIQGFATRLEAKLETFKQTNPKPNLNKSPSP